ncbi:MAG TPA: energy-coupling factor transporter transmembrane protein EcfT [Anaerolineae bacterium]|nr:energy-coupling factor transporter transmembrane protein EcfT [Anaerolineae bacterium]
MEDFEFLRHITIGQYLPGDSLIHRLDPRTKLSVFLFITIAVTFSISYISNIILVLVALGLVLISRIPLRYIFSGLKPAVPIIIMLAVLQLLFYGNAFAPYGAENRTLFHWGLIHVTTGSIQLVIVSAMRFVELLFLTSLLTNTTTLTDLTHGMENMLRPFSRIGVPSHELSLVMTIALRFVPLLAEQLEIIMKAQASRGADIAHKGKLQFITTAKQVAALIVPLFIDAFRRGEDLILAMQARCYVGGKGRSSLVHLKFQKIDYVAYAFGLIFSLAVLVTHRYMPF